MEAALDQPVLVLNRLWQAVNVIAARRAFALLAREHAQVVHQTEDAFRTYSLMDWIDFSSYNPPVDALETVRRRGGTIRAWVVGDADLDVDAPVQHTGTRWPL